MKKQSMHCIRLRDEADFEAFKEAARGVIAAHLSPGMVSFQVGSQGELFDSAVLPAKLAPLNVPAAYPDLAGDVICHRDPERFALLYQALWRIVQGERALLADAADPLVHRLRLMQKSVQRDLHKMTAFVRFRSVRTDDGEHFIAWFEPEHFILRRNAAFFADRFAGMQWSILTPNGSLHWDKHNLEFGPAVAKENAPRNDALEDWWRSYYRSTFNPARANPTAMRAHMPKKYWRNLPESEIIPGLLDHAAARTAQMIASAPSLPRRAAAPSPHAAPVAHDDWSMLKAQAAACERCPLFGAATKTVFGEGPSDAPVVFVGEQPGDQEDLAGRPFIGPAGQLLDRALMEVGIDRSRIYVTNAVKHFKYEARGKKRIHQKPDNSEIEACRWWLERELAFIKPRLTVALGATAARALTGRSLTLTRVRGQVMTFAPDRVGIITVHPSYLLRLPDQAAQASEYDRFIADLKLVAEQIPAIRRAA